MISTTSLLSGSSDFDRTHRFVLSYTWNLPQPVNATGSYPAISGGGLLRCRDVPIRTPFQYLDSAAAHSSGRQLLHQVTLHRGDAEMRIQSGNVSGRVNQFFKHSAFVSANAYTGGRFDRWQFPVAATADLWKL